MPSNLVISLATGFFKTAQPAAASAPVLPYTDGIYHAFQYHVVLVNESTITFRRLLRKDLPDDVLERSFEVHLGAGQYGSFQLKRLGARTMFILDTERLVAAHSDAWTTLG